VFIVHRFVNLPSFGIDVVIPGFIVGYVKPLDAVCKTGAIVAPITVRVCLVVVDIHIVDIVKWCC
jgi:hypothetical protein